MTSDVPEKDAPRRRTTILVTVAAVALLAVVIIVLLVNRGGGPSAGAAAGSAASPSQPISTTSPRPGAGTAASTVPSPSLPPATASGKPSVVPTKPTRTTQAPLHSDADLGNGVKVRVTKIENVKGEAQGPGEIAGPAVRVTVEVSNQTEKEVPMDLALVNLYYGTDKTPASTLSGPGAAPLAKPVPAGQTASGTYVFTVPADQRNPLTVEFSYTTDAPTVIFSGKP
jgi:hypothetical protein